MKGINPKLLLAAVLAGMLVMALSLGLCVQDDTYISLRYARNLVDGHGLVFNAGEPPVEGYTNFLWTVELAAALALGLNGVLASVWMGLTCAVGLVVLTWHWGSRSRFVAGRDVLVLVAPLLVALDPGLLLEAVQGLETLQFTLLVTLCVWATTREMKDPEQVPWSGLFGGLAALTRPEGLLFYGLLQLARVLHRRRAPNTATGVGWAVFLVFVLSHLAYRWRFYGDLLPNTFYAKTGGGVEMWTRGLQYLGEFAFRHLGLVGLAMLGAWAAVRRAEARDVASLLVVSVYLVYVISVGGDFKHSGRFVLPVLPLLALWAQDGLGWLLNRAARVGMPSRLVALAVTVLCASNLASYWPTSRGAAAYRVKNQQERIAVAELLRTRFPADTWIALHSAGTIPYMSGLPTLDCLGLSDLHIARMEIEGMGTGMPGHEKFDYVYVFDRHPTLYLPELDLVTVRPRQLLVPTDFPPDFDHHYQQRSAILPSGQAVNFWLHQGHGVWPQPAAPDEPAHDAGSPVTPDAG